MDSAKPWYLSTTILALLAGALIWGLNAIGILPVDLTQDKLVAFLAAFIPMVVGIVTRFTATKQVTATKAAADAINKT